jgi:tetratricopeptide (TPR) repeat protein
MEKHGNAKGKGRREDSRPKTQDSRLKTGSILFWSCVSCLVSSKLYALRSMLKVCLLVMCVLLMLLSQVELALSDEVLSLADRLMELGSYDEAITEYKRFIFFNPKGEDTGCALHRMGLAYRAGYNWQEAIDAFRASILAAEDSRVADERRIVLATTLIASGNYSLARLELLRVSESSERPSLYLKSLYFGGVACLYMFDWDAAREAFGGFYSLRAGLRSEPTGRTMERAKEIESILFQVRRSYKSVRLARSLSTIFPGLGQIYAGDWRDGLNALALNGLTVALLANAICRRDYRDAVLISSISIRYYMGNIYHAGMDVRKYNESLDRRNAAKILRLAAAEEPF